MATFIDIEASAMALSENERSLLASRLLGSLPPVLADNDEGVAEALRRDAELDANPDSGMTMAEFKAAFED